MNIYGCVAMLGGCLIAGAVWVVDRAMFYKSRGQSIEEKLNVAMDRLAAHQGALDAINTKADETRTEALRLTEKLTTLQNRIGRA